LPAPHQRQAAAVAFAAGASLIIGNHPHVVQALELIEGALVVYALGNFVFDQDWSLATQQGAVLEAGFGLGRLLGFRLRPIAIRELYRPEFVTPAGPEGSEILGRIWDASDLLPPHPGLPALEEGEAPPTREPGPDTPR
jgi:poly-gamma-glutamate synthesis protein (capsule biosynthesis protein)